MAEAASLSAGFTVADADGRVGALVAFPFDRALLERFRARFPQARFRRRESRWFVPGKRAARRLDAWIARELSLLDAHADAKGRDAYAFEPLVSPYLQVGTDLVVRTPYGRDVVSHLRAIPFARFDDADRAWHVPFRSYDGLKSRWPAIEAAAREAEPEARRLRRERERAAATPEMLAAARRLAGERRRRRAPVAMREPPPVGEPVATPAFGVVVFEALDADPIPAAECGEDLGRVHPALGEAASTAGRWAWGWWRLPLWRELRRLTGGPEPGAPERARGWWAPTGAEIEARRQRLREGFRARATRAGASA